jgi:hypothetical protein
MYTPAFVAGFMAYRSCISTWLAKSSTCPTDRQPLRPSLLKPPHRIVASMLSRLRLRCPHHHKGCTVILTPDTVDQHEVSSKKTDRYALNESLL